MYCTECGAQLREGAVFCHKCGKKIHAEEKIQHQTDVSGVGSQVTEVQQNVNSPVAMPSNTKNVSQGRPETKKKSKLWLKILIGAAVLYVLSLFINAFGDAISKQQSSGVAESGDISSSNSNIANDRPSGSSANQQKGAEYIGDNLWLRNISEFSEGRAWVEFYESERKNGSVEALSEAVDSALGSDIDRALYAMENGSFEGNNRAALIDTQGRIVWESELTEHGMGYTSEFIDGMAYFVFYGNDEDTFNIIDSDGNILYTRELYNENEDFKVLGHGGGLCLLAEHVENFDTNEWRIGAIDKNGELAMPFQAFDLPPMQKEHQLYPDEAEMYYPTVELYLEDNYSSAKYLGDNVFQLFFYNGYALLNVDSQRIIYCSQDLYRYDAGSVSYDPSYQFITGFEDGTAIVSYGDFYSFARGLYSLGTDGSLTPRVNNPWTQSIFLEDAVFSEGLMFVGGTGGEDTLVIDREYYDRTHDLEGAEAKGMRIQAGSYYNMEGELMIDFPEYQGKWYSSSPFHGGYALMIIEGADGADYFTAINKDGERMFEPKTGFEDVCISEDGRYLTAYTPGSITVFDITGNPLVRIDYGGINTFLAADGYQYNVRDGVIKVLDVYVNVEEGKVIGLYQSYDDFSLTVY